MTELAAEHGVGVADCLRGTRIEPDLLHNLAGEVASYEEFDVIRNLLRHCAGAVGLRDDHQPHHR